MGLFVGATSHIGLHVRASVMYVSMESSLPLEILILDGSKSLLPQRIHEEQTWRPGWTALHVQFCISSHLAGKVGHRLGQTGRDTPRATSAPYHKPACRPCRGEGICSSLGRKG